MAQYFEVHPDNPQPRLLKQAAAMLKDGGILAVPTDSSYAFVCALDNKQVVDRLRRIRQIDEKRMLTLLCSDLSQLSTYAMVDNHSSASSNWARRGLSPLFWMRPKRCRAASATHRAKPLACACPTARAC